MKKFILFFKAYLIITNILLIILVSILLVLSLFWGLSIYTKHGKTVPVPNVMNMPLSEASQILTDQGFRYEIYDSVYVEEAIPGSIAEQIPAGESNVKSGRKIHLKTYSYFPNKISCPNVEDMSSTNAIANLESSGFRKIIIKEVEAEFNDVVLGVEYNGEKILPGTPIYSNVTLTLLVGKVEEEEDDFFFE